MQETELYLYAALFFTMTGYAFYWYALRKELVRPNRFSWLIWSAVTTVEALTYQAVNEGMVQNLIFLMSAASCLFVTIAIWRESAASKPALNETIAMGMSLAALVIWLVFNSSYWAHLLMVAAVPVSFLPTWLSAKDDPRNEMSPAWGFWTMADVLTLLLITRSGTQDPMELPYVVVEFICQGAIWLTIGWRSINPLLAFGDDSVIADSRYFCGNPPDSFRLEENGKGLAIVSSRAFPNGSRLLEMSGKRWHISEILAHREGREDRFMQVDDEIYIGPSGRFDDLLNHSCDPNCGLHFLDETIILMAIKPISPGDELCFDYSTTSSASQFSMRCHCGADTCRNVIGDFEFLEPDIQRHYLGLGLVPPYLMARYRPLLLPEPLAA